MNKYVVLFMTVALLHSCKKTATRPTEVKSIQKFYKTSEFIMGADLSYVNAVEDHGGIYKNKNIPTDPFQLFKSKGTNVVRVRLWHSPEKIQSELGNKSIYSSLADVKKSISRAKTAGMEVLLDFHYSDEWADPSKQFTPEAWQHTSLGVLQDSVYNYTFETLRVLSAEGLTPEYVQIGNETNQGMLFPRGKIISHDFGNFAALLKSGIKAVQNFSATSTIQPKVIIHVAQLQNLDYWLSGLQTEGVVELVDFVGVSHYFNYSDFKMCDEIQTEVKRIIDKFGKQLIVLETAYPWTTQNGDSYNNIVSGMDVIEKYPPTKEGQKAYLRDLTTALIRGGASGIFYWEPAWISSSLNDGWGKGSSWENQTLFDFDGNPVPAFDFMTTDYTNDIK